MIAIIIHGELLVRIALIIAASIIFVAVFLTIRYRNVKLNCPNCGTAGFEDGLFCANCGWEE